MDPDSPAWLRTRIVQSRSAVLCIVVLLCGLVLNLTVLDANPVSFVTADAPAPTNPPGASEAAPTVIVGAPVRQPDVGPVTTEQAPVESVPPEQAEQPVPAVAPVAAVPQAQVVPIAPAAPAPVAPAPVVPAPVAPAPAPLAAPATPAIAAPAPMTPAAPAAPTTMPVVTAAPTTIPTVTSPVTTIAAPTIPATTAPPSTAPATTAPPAVEYLTYTVDGGVGEVVLAARSNSISLYGFYPNSGWVSETEDNGPKTVKLKFFNVQTEKDREWKATLDGDRIKVEN